MSAAQIAEQQQHNTQNLPTPHRHTPQRYIYQPTMLFFPREIRSVLSGIQQLRERPSVRVRPGVGWLAGRPVVAGDTQHGTRGLHREADALCTRQAAMI